jgi:hypothetical protein
MLLQAGAAVVGVFLPLIAVVFYLVMSVFFIIDPLRPMCARRRWPCRIERQCRWVSTTSLRTIIPRPRPAAIELANSSCRPRS